MTRRIKQSGVLLLAAGFYLLAALSVPYLLIDHEAGIAAGHSEHAPADIHKWLEWAVGLSLTDAALVLAAVLLQAISFTISFIRVPSSYLVFTLGSRGPPNFLR